MSKNNLSICFIILLSPILLFCSPKAINSSSDSYLYHFCGNESSYTAFGPFYNNLNRLLLQRLYVQGGISVYYNTSTVGDPPDEAYGAFLCRGDVAPSDCQSCIDDVSSRIMESCPGKKSAIMWYDQCLVRYSDRNFIGVMEEFPAFYMWNTVNVTDQEKLVEALADTFPKLINETVSDPSKGMYGTNNISISSTFFSLYELVQCFPDLSETECSSCLSSAFGRMPQYTQGARIFLPSCNIRYETYPFYGTPRNQETAPGPKDSLPNNTANEIDPRPKRRKRRRITVGLSIGAAFLIVVSLSYIIYVMRKRNSKEGRDSQEVQLLDLKRKAKSEEFRDHGYFHEEQPVNSHEFLLMRLEVILAATNNFSGENKLGEGGFGPVYKGVLEDGKEIAVKRLSGTSGQGLLELRTEVTLIARLQHRNLVRLLGCCLEDDEKLLIYEYMPNKSLDAFLFGSGTTTGLDWKERLNIINGIARGLLYLHEDSRLRIIHRDLKASNILLDHDMNPKISDFGMARIVGGNQTSDTTNRVVGTYGYMAPEYAMEGLYSVKSDVFSFGVLLLELLSGRRNNGFHLHQHGQSLLTYAWSLWGEGRALELIDPSLGESLDAAQVLKCIHIGLLCVQEESEDRPDMSLVVLMLKGDTTSLPQPTQPAFSVGRRIAATDAPGSDHRISSINGLTISNVSPR